MATRNAVYAKFGIAAEAAQLFETELGSILLALEAKERRWHISLDPKTASAFYERLNRKTLGQILAALKEYIALGDEVELKFQRGLSARNRLNHGFFEGHNFAIYKVVGRDLMIADLATLHERLVDAWQTAQTISTSLVGELITARGSQSGDGHPQLSS